MSFQTRIRDLQHKLNLPPSTTYVDTVLVAVKRIEELQCEYFWLTSEYIVRQQALRRRQNWRIHL